MLTAVHNNPAVILTCLLLVAGCGRDGESQAVPADGASNARAGVVHVSPEAQRELVVEPLLHNPVRQEVIIQGRMQYGLDGFVRLSSPLPGVVKAVRGRLGDLARRGQALLSIHSADIGTAYSDFTKAESDRRLAHQSFQLTADLYNVKALPEKEYEQAENDLQKAEAEYVRARERLLALNVSESELAKPMDQRQITARFDVKSPLDGVIVEKHVTVGQLVKPEDVLYTIADPDRLQAVGEVYERDLRMLRLGMSASVHVESFPAIVFPATIAYIGDVVDAATRTIKVRCSVTNLDHKLKADMFVRIEIDVASQSEGLGVPPSALIRIGDKTFTYVQRSPVEYERREVVTGPLSGELIEIRDGIKLGERIVMKGGLLLEGALEKGPLRP
jgi:cobalt-zinc-cadmium efflux system membrane fusion protein